MIDGRVMDENCVDQTVKLGDTEEWTERMAWAASSRDMLIDF